jgi:hypothetical protein
VGSTTKIANITLKILSGYHITINDFFGKFLSFFFETKKLGNFWIFFFQENSTNFSFSFFKTPNSQYQENEK